ncbi:putative zinc metalloproteinase YIL108W [Ixodes scapularis]|uniref:putative zinc metalloproteinase YIL108W n=1 Tax=Ixodes scapularis TaxID=6945 RepID=UPI001A9E8E52|nr:putative zinc metalloproteinase YIL108W [Ixodes scapularis]
MIFKITSPKADEVLGWSLALIRGRYLGSDRIDAVEVANLLEGRDAHPVSWPVAGGAFVAFVSLLPGTNAVRLGHGDLWQDLVLRHEPPGPREYVRPAYVVCQDEPDRGPSVEGALQRVALGARILQALLAETLAAAGFQRRTFCLEPAVHVFRTGLTVAEARSMAAGKVWRCLAEELVRSALGDPDRCKLLAFASWADAEPSGTAGHPMVGAGGLALCGDGRLRSWPLDLRELAAGLGDAGETDRPDCPDIQCCGGSPWACFWSSLGGVLHELGHVLDLVHADVGIMGRGFHHLALLCAPSEDPQNAARISWGPPHFPAPKAAPPSEQDPGTPGGKIPLTRLEPKLRPAGMHGEGVPGDGSGGPYWSRSCAVILNYHRWINSGMAGEDRTPIEFTGSGLASSHGIRLVEFRHPDDRRVLGFWEFPRGCLQLALEPRSIRAALPAHFAGPPCDQGQRVELFAIDSLGNTIKTHFQLS